MPSPPVARLRADGSTVDLGSATYVQRKLLRKREDHSCTGCVAYTKDLRLCDALCPYCEEEHVFLRAAE